MGPAETKADDHDLSRRQWAAEGMPTRRPATGTAADETLSENAVVLSRFALPPFGCTGPIMICSSSDSFSIKLFFYYYYY
jgi:hypothetical protein